MIADLKTPIIALAPMAGVTDAAFRIVCRDFGADYTVTEMVSAKALTYNDPKTPSLLSALPGERPFAAQIFGNDPETMARGAEIAHKISKADAIDINMGCPVGKIVKNREGSALMLDLPRARDIIKAAAAAVDVPVTVKFRRGFDSGHINCVQFAEMCEDAGAAMICVHGRTRTQMYSGNANWDCIRDVVKAVSIPVLANGDVFSAGDAMRILDHTKAAGIMVGRGAMGNPWIFGEIKALLSGAKAPNRPSRRAIAEIVLRQFDLAAADKGEKLACLDARRHFAWYLRGLPNASMLRREVVKIETLRDIRAIAENLASENIKW